MFDVNRANRPLSPEKRWVAAVRSGKEQTPLRGFERPPATGRFDRQQFTIDRINPAPPRVGSEPALPLSAVLFYGTSTRRRTV